MKYSDTTMGDCIPTSDFDSISTFPPAAKQPIIALAVVFSVVTTVAIVVVAVLIWKLYQLRTIGAKLQSNVSGISGKMPDVDVEGLKGKLPDVAVDIHKPNISVDPSGAVSLGYDKTLEFGANVKGALHGALNAELNLGLSLDNPFYVIFNALPYASILVDERGIVVKANVVSKLKWGYPSAELEGKLYKTLVSPRALDARMDLFDDLLKGRKPSFEIDSFDQKIDGAEIEVEVIASAIHIAGKLYLFIITGHVCYDATGRRHKDN